MWDYVIIDYYTIYTKLKVLYSFNVIYSSMDGDY